ncbi:hypothetical protein D7Y13_00555 [Corallococcus praedator]|uniref:Uncharacterized protein n=1 Tax=Corallococcus praedator TaxID=2316724 RepID=A0ABX9QRZ6_9BACT|nr:MULTISPECIES: hypothetical protein [Corallococcus]RKH21180.1 hypothetical protein D7X74_01980 [Corallococcus sp. CA047B]RKH35918.1 hypothetical protein D7X75_02605 [Corallococcus sp. CA031C]RKI17618.1 hypothetical protein D7Y13_00555 [Corallococcus praedator]
MLKSTGALVVALFTLLPLQGQAQKQDCATAFDAVAKAGQLDNAEALVSNDCVVMYTENWLQGAGKKNDAVCGPAWKALEASGATASVRSLVIQDCAVVHMTGWKAMSQPQGAAAGQCSIGQLMTAQQKVQEQQTNLCKKVGKGSVDAEVAKKVQACFDTHVTPAVAKSPGLKQFVDECVVKKNAWAADSMCNKKNQWAVSSCETKTFKAKKAALMKELTKNIGGFCAPADAFATCMTEATR